MATLSKLGSVAWWTMAVMAYFAFSAATGCASNWKRPPGPSVRQALLVEMVSCAFSWPAIIRLLTFSPWSRCM